MTIAQRIRDTMHLDAHEAAKVIGISVQDVYSKRWIVRNPDRARVSRMARSERRRRRLGMMTREEYLADSPWPHRDKDLAKFVDAGLSFESIARKLGTTRGAVAGRVFRLRKGESP